MLCYVCDFRPIYCYPFYYELKTCPWHKPTAGETDMWASSPVIRPHSSPNSKNTDVDDDDDHFLKNIIVY